MNLTFATPALLIGLLAAGIPVALHLIANARAPREYLPTLRFLRDAIEFTARRRRIRQWVLLLLRSIMLGLLAIALAEPMTKWLAPVGLGRNAAVAVVLDNSLSMQQRYEGNSVFDRAQSDIRELLSGDNQPAMLGLWTTNTPDPKNEAMTTQFDALREAIEVVALDGSPAPLGRTTANAIDALRSSQRRQRIVCVFTDMQFVSTETLPDLIADPEDGITLIVIAPNAGITPEDVGVRGLAIEGHPIVNANVSLNATLINAGAEAALADVELVMDGQPTGQRARLRLPPAGAVASETPITFAHRLTTPTDALVEVRVDTHDAFDPNNTRQVGLQVQRALDVLIVAGPGAPESFNAPGSILELAMDPFPGTEKDVIRVERFDAARFSATMLPGRSAVFFCQVPSLSSDQIRATDTFIREGGLAVFLLGDGVNPDDYNAMRTATDGPWVPVTIEAPTGRTGSDAPTVASEWINTAHPSLAGIYASDEQYPTMLARRYVPMKSNSAAASTLIRLANGDPLLVERTIGSGRMLVCAVPDDPAASNVMTEPLIPAMLLRSIFSTCAASPSDNGLNPSTDEMDLTTLDPDRILSLRERGFTNVWFATSLADARSQLATKAAGENWWDVLAVIVIVVLLTEAFVANRNLLSGPAPER